MRGPEITPQSWFRNLPDLPNSFTGDTLAIFTGTVNGLSNLVVHMLSSSLGVVVESAGVFWRFDYGLGVFEAVANEGGNWATQIIEQSGRALTTRTTLTLSEVTRDMVKYKFDPAT